MDTRFVTECEDYPVAHGNCRRCKPAGKSKGNRLFGRRGRRWKIGTKIDLMGAGCVLGEWIKLTDNMAFWNLGLTLREP
jgi:hypothetical protein